MYKLSSQRRFMAIVFIMGFFSVGFNLCLGTSSNVHLLDHYKKPKTGANFAEREEYIKQRLNDSPSYNQVLEAKTGLLSRRAYLTNQIRLINFRSSDGEGLGNKSDILSELGEVNNKIQKNTAVLNNILKDVLDNLPPKYMTSKEKADLINKGLSVFNQLILSSREKNAEAEKELEAVRLQDNRLAENIRQFRCEMQELSNTRGFSGAYHQVDDSRGSLMGSLSRGGFMGACVSSSTGFACLGAKAALMLFGMGLFGGAMVGGFLYEFKKSKKAKNSQNSNSNTRSSVNSVAKKD